MKYNLQGKKVAILVADGFEQSEFEEPKNALEQSNAEAVVVSPNSGNVTGWKEEKWGDAFNVNVPLDQARAAEFDALVLPGGVINPDTLRVNEDAIRFSREFFEAGKPVAAICHGPQLLINAGVVEGRTLTSYPSIRKDLENAGAKVVDEPVVVDQGLVTSRNPDDLSQFCDKMCEEIAEGKHAGQTA
jgi:protease I